MANMMKAVHDKVSPSAPRTMFINCGEAINALDLNKDASKAVVAGKVFRILDIGDDKFEEKLNLRVGKNHSENTNYILTDVAWHQNEDHILASSATNGAIIIWDLHKISKFKQEHSYKDHKRVAYRVRFHETEMKWLLSGSMDGTVKLFDIKVQKAVKSFDMGYGIRDVQFCPISHGYFQFASADEGGNIQLWDIRKNNTPEKVITAHNGPVFSLDWHPDERGWICTAGRDNTIKVWDTDTSPSSNKNIFTISTMDPVHHVKWRPERKFDIASTSLHLDFSVNIWNVQRPYIPFATFDEHKNVATCVLWKKNDPHVFYSAGKDYMLYQHIFKDANRPADKVVPSGLDLGLSGDILHSHRCKMLPSKSSTGKLNFLKRNPTKGDNFTQAVSSNLFFYSCNTTEHDSLSWFPDSALKYRLKGHSFDEICEHNALVAEEQGRLQTAESWRILRIVFSQNLMSSLLTTTDPKHVTYDADFSNKKVNEGKTNEKYESQKDINLTSGCSDNESDKEVIKENLSSIARGMNPPADWEVLFGDEYADDVLHDEKQFQESTVLPNEAFSPRHEIQEGTHHLESLHNGHESPQSTNESEGTQNNQHNHVTSKHKAENEVIIGISCEPSLPDMDLSSVVTEVLKFQAEQGDVQTAATMLIVLGKFRPDIDLTIQENWFQGYIELLQRFKLWSVANKIIKISHLPHISSMNQRSTSIPLKCSQCNKVVTRTGWLCEKCHAVINLCAICHLPVKGLFLWCQGCSHGGHVHHIKEWLSLSNKCPTGCGHLCEYT